LHLPAQRLQRFVDLALDLFARQLKRLLHLLTHGLGDLALQLTEDRLHGLADLFLKSLTEILLRGGGLSLVAVRLWRGPTAFRPVLSPALWLSLPTVVLLSALAVVAAWLSLTVIAP